MPTVPYPQLSLAQQVLQRQSDCHLCNLAAYIDQNARIAAFDLGLLLSALYPINEVLVDGSARIVRLAGGIYDSAAHRLASNIEQYADADQEVYRLLQRVAAEMGETLPPWQDPRHSLPQLGSAQNGATTYHGGAQPGIFEQAAQQGSDARETIDRWVTQAQDRLGSWMTPSGQLIHERQDASSYLVPPAPRSSEIENLRWSAGILLGSIDWVWEQIAGWSIIEEVIMKPFVGDWDSFEMAGQAWDNTDAALTAISANTAAITNGMAEWESKGSDAFVVAMTTLSAAMLQLSYLAGNISGLLGVITLVSRQAATQIGKLLQKMEKRLARILAGMSIPIAGWAASLINFALDIDDIIADTKKAIAIVNMIMDAIYNVIEAKAKMADVAFIVEDLASGLARRMY